MKYGHIQLSEHEMWGTRDRVSKESLMKRHRRNVIV
jgi:hypothetical protein